MGLETIKEPEGDELFDIPKRQLSVEEKEYVDGLNRMVKIIFRIYRIYEVKDPIVVQRYLIEKKNLPKTLCTLSIIQRWINLFEKEYPIGKKINDK